MSALNLLKTAGRVFYYEGVNGVVLRVKARRQRRSPPPVADHLPDREEGERRKWEESIMAHLTHTKMVLLEGERDFDGGATERNRQRELLMLIPPPEQGSGGRMTMARILRNLAASEIRCHVAFYPEVPDEAFSACERAWSDEFEFTPDECAVLRLEDAKARSFDVAIATFWPSAYVLRHQIRARSKGYLVQDFEPYFYPPGSNYAFAEESYRLGLWGICASPWLAKKLSDDYGMVTQGFELGVDKDEYHIDPAVSRDGRLVVAYIRQHTERRGYEFVMWALKKIKDEMPDVRIEIFGDGRLPPGEFLWIDKNHGILDHSQLRTLYNRAAVGIVTSFTNYSLIPNEMMACGCAVVDLDMACMRSVFPQDAISLATPTPRDVAGAVKALVTDPDKRSHQATRGLAYVADVSWERTLAEINDAVVYFSGGKSADLGALSGRTFDSRSDGPALGTLRPE